SCRLAMLSFYTICQAEWTRPVDKGWNVGTLEGWNVGTLEGWTVPHGGPGGSRIRNPDPGLKTRDSRLQTQDSRLQTRDSRLQTQGSSLQTPRLVMLFVEAESGFLGLRS